MPAPTFDPAQLSRYAIDRSIRRGEEYFSSGAVETLVLRGDELEADVQGNAPRPYRVWIEFDAEGVADATCTCPYDYEGWCKHIVAALLAYAKQPGEVDIRSPLAERLEVLDRSQLQAILLELVDRIPRLNDAIEAALPYVTLAAAGSTASPATAGHPPLATVNTRALRQNVRSTMRSRGGWDEEDDYDEDGYSVVDGIIQLADQAQPALDAGDGRTALVVLEAVTDEFSKHWEMLEETGEETSTFFDGTASLWIEALLDPARSSDPPARCAGNGLPARLSAPAPARSRRRWRCAVRR